MKPATTPMAASWLESRGAEVIAAPRAFDDPRVAAAFDEMPAEVRPAALMLRTLIFDVADTIPEAGPIHETLKWGQPAYLTQETGSGTTLRIGIPKCGGYAIYAHCQTTVIADFAALTGDAFQVEGNRAVRFRSGDPVPQDALRPLIRHALTYHLAGTNC